MDTPYDNLIKEAQSGNITARNELIEKSKPFILKVTTKFCGRKLSWENDEELSISLLALDEAIDSFDHLAGSSFSSYAYLVINRRLIDYMRKEKKNKHQVIIGENHTLDLLASKSISSGMNSKELEKIMWQEEMHFFVEALNSYGIKIEDLVEDSPKHKKVRQKLANMAQMISADKKMAAHIKRTHRLPVKEICRNFKVRRKFVETWRRYLLALIIIIIRPEFALIKDYIGSLFQEGRNKNETN